MDFLYFFCIFSENRGKSMKNYKKLLWRPKIRNHHEILIRIQINKIGHSIRIYFVINVWKSVFPEISQFFVENLVQLDEIFTDLPQIFFTQSLFYWCLLNIIWTFFKNYYELYKFLKTRRSERTVFPSFPTRKSLKLYSPRTKLA